MAGGGLLRAIGWVLACCAATASAGEPPARLGLEIGGTTIEVEAGQRFEFEVDGKATSARIVELPTRRFDEAGIRFEYPRHFPWEHDAPDMWTLDGNSAVLILTRADADADTTAAGLLDGVEESLRSARRASREKVVLPTRRGDIQGLASRIRIGELQMRNEAYVLVADDARFFLILQDSLDDDGRPTAEFNEMRKRLAATLEF